MKKQTRTANDFKSLGTVHNRAVAQLDLIDEENRIIPFILVSRDNAGLRYDWWEDEIFEERLDVNGATFERLNTFFKNHTLSVDSAIGRVENVRIEDGEIKANVRFGSNGSALDVFRKYQEGILTDVSIGYNILEVVTTERNNQPTEVLVTRYDIFEVSAVWMGFDKNAKIGRNAEAIPIENLKKEVKDNEETSELLEAENSRAKRERALLLAEKSILQY